jgi:hypothetical protein
MHPRKLGSHEAVVANTQQNTSTSPSTQRSGRQTAASTETPWRMQKDSFARPSRCQPLNCSARRVTPGMTQESAARTRPKSADAQTPKDQAATAAAGDAMKQQYKRKATLRDRALDKEDPKYRLLCSAHRLRTQQSGTIARQSKSDWPRAARPWTRSTTRSRRSANQKLSDKKLDVTATTVGASGGGAEGGGGRGGGGGGGGAGSGPAHDGSSDAGDAQDADEAERTAAAQRKADALAELAFAALTDHQVDNLHLQIVSVMVVTRHFYAAWKTYCERVEHTPVGTPIERLPNVTRAISPAGLVSALARPEVVQAPGANHEGAKLVSAAILHARLQSLSWLSI